MAPLPVTATVTDKNGQIANSVGGSVTLGTTGLIQIGETALQATEFNNHQNLLFVQPITLTQAASIKSLSFYVTATGGQLRLCVYTSTASGFPGTLVAQTAAFTPVAGWNTQVTTTTPTLQAGNYFLGYLPQSNSLGFLKGATGGPSYFGTVTFGSLPTTFPATTPAGLVHWSLYGTFTGSPMPTVWVNSVAPGGIVPPGPNPGSIPINPVTGTFWPYSGNTGYLNAPGFNTSDNPTPGALTAFSGNSANIPPGTYKYILFNPGAGQGCGAFQSGAYSFTGCWFQGNNDSGAILNVGGTSFAADWCSITPIPSLVALSTSFTNGGIWPPGGGGYTNWPSANIARLTNGNFYPDQATFDANTLYQNYSSQYGVNLNTSGPASFNHIDMWGMGNGVEVANASATPWTWINSWVHDNRSDYLGTAPFQNNDHTDGIGMFTDQHYVDINFSNNTLASFGNTNALSNQFTKLGPNSVVRYTQIGNYLSGYNYNIGWSDPGQSFTTAIITDNVYATDVPGGFGPSNQDISGSFGNGSGNRWRTNTFRIATRNPILIASRWDNWQFSSSWNGQFIYPDSSVNQFTHATDWALGP